MDAEDQLRSQFTRGNGTVAVVDPDEWDDCGDAASYGSYNSILSSPLIQTSNRPIQISFDSHYRQEAPQQVYFNVMNSSGNINETLLHYSSNAGSDNGGGDMLNQRLSFNIETNENEIYLFKGALVEKLNSKKYKIKVILDGQKEGYVIDVKSYLNMKCFSN